jgi:hypothetical protein
MRIEVLKVVDPPQGVVSFRCESGTANGFWKGSRSAEVAEFDVEIEVPEEVAEWVPSASGSTSLSGITEDAFAVLVTGEVVACGSDDDPVVELRVGAGVILAEITDRRSELSVGDLISFRTPEIHLYPYDV